MPRTRSSYNQDTGFSDGFAFIPPQQLSATSGTATLTRAGKGLLALDIGASQTCVFMSPLNGLMFRKGTNFIIGENFGTAAGVPGISGVSGTSDADASIGGIPTPNSTATQLIPRTSYIPKGVSILDITPVYTITGAVLTTNTIGLSETLFSNDAAPVVSDILANAANGLATAIQSEPYVTKVAVNSGYLVADLAEYILEMDISTGAGGSAVLYGAFVHLLYNYN